MKKPIIIGETATAEHPLAIAEANAKFRTQSILENNRNFQSLSEKHKILLQRKIVFDAFSADVDTNPSMVTISSNSNSFTLSDSQASKDVIDILNMRNDRFISALETEICNFVF